MQKKRLKMITKPIGMQSERKTSWYFIVRHILASFCRQPQVSNFQFFSLHILSASPFLAVHIFWCYYYYFYSFFLYKKIESGFLSSFKNKMEKNSKKKSMHVFLIEKRATTSTAPKRCLNKKTNKTQLVKCSMFILICM